MSTKTRILLQADGAVFSNQNSFRQIFLRAYQKMGLLMPDRLSFVDMTHMLKYLEAKQKPKLMVVREPRKTRIGRSRYKSLARRYGFARYKAKKGAKKNHINTYNLGRTAGQMITFRPAPRLEAVPIPRERVHWNVDVPQPPGPPPGFWEAAHPRQVRDVRDHLQDAMDAMIPMNAAVNRQWDAMVEAGNPVAQVEPEPVPEAPVLREGAWFDRNF